MELKTSGFLSIFYKWFYDTNDFLLPESGLKFLYKMLIAFIFSIPYSILTLPYRTIKWSKNRFLNDLFSFYKCNRDRKIYSGFVIYFIIYIIYSMILSLYYLNKLNSIDANSLIGYTISIGLCYLILFSFILIIFVVYKIFSFFSKYIFPKIKINKDLFKIKLID